MTRWPTQVTGAIAEAVASELRFKDAYRKLKAGTLPGLDGPVAMPERTFASHWTRAKRAQKRARDRAPVCPTCGRPKSGAPAEAANEAANGGQRSRPQALLERIRQDLAADQEKAADDAASDPRI